MNLIKKAAAVLAAASMVLSLSACGSSLNWAARIGDDTTLPIGLYIYNQAAGYRTSVQSGRMNSYTKLAEQTVEVSGSDKDAQEYLDETAVKAVKSCAGAMLMAQELGVELTEEELSNAAENAREAYELDEEVYTENGVAQTSIEEYYKDLTRKNKVFEAKYGKDGTDPVPDEELKAFFAENYATINFMQQYYYTEDGEMMSDEQIAALKKEYEEIKKKAEKGKLDFVKECEKVADNMTNYKGAAVDSTSRFDTDDEDGQKILNLKEGEYTLLVTESAIALIQKAKLDKDGTKFEEYRSTLLIESKFDDFIKELVKYAEQSGKVQFNEKAFKKFATSTRDYSDLNVSNSYY